MGKVDLKDAYLTVPIARRHRKFLRFSWKGRKFQFKSLPFGLATPPRTFTKLLKPVAARLRQQGLRVVFYIDDILLMSTSVEELETHMGILASSLEELGFLMNTKKCVKGPLQVIEFLGFLVDSRQMTLSLPQDKMHKIEKECRHLMNKRQATVRLLAHVIELLNSTVQAVLPARLHYRGLQRLKNKVFHQSGNFDCPTLLSQEALDDLQFWIVDLRKVQYRTL